MRGAIAIGLALVPLLAAPAGRAEADVQLWMEAGVSRQLDKRFELSFEQHLRFDQDVSRVQAVMPELSLSIRLHELLRLGLGYRFQYERDKDGVLVVRHRGHVDLRTSYDVGPLEVSYRARFTEEVRGSFASDDLRHTFRNRLAIELEATDPWAPAVAAETFHRLGDGDTIRLQKLRLTAGISRELGDHEIDLFYRVEVAQDDPTDPTPHIIGVGYHHDL